MKDRYDGIDGLKAFSILGIVLMHVFSNGNFELSNVFFSKIIPSFADLVFLFMMLSGFGMCCGYYNKVINNQIRIADFYKRRYSKIWPFFALLCVIDFCVSPSKDSIYEIFANLTLCQGLLPNMNISVIGVSWTLAVIFVFYLLFPFYCFLLENNKKACIAFICALIYNYLCSSYFFDDSHINAKSLVNFSARTNIIYCSVFFISGGIVYLNRCYISKFVSSHKIFSCAIVLFTSLLYFLFSNNTIVLLAFCVSVLAFSLGTRVWLLSNSVSKFLGGICFEIYLCHMVIFRGLEKVNLIHFFKNDLVAFISTSIVVMIGAVAFSLLAQYFIKRISFSLKVKL